MYIYPQVGCEAHMRREIVFTAMSPAPGPVPTSQ